LRELRRFTRREHLPGCRRPWSCGSAASMTTTAWMWLVLLTAIAISATVGLVVRFVQQSRAKRGKFDGS